jgi:hypothetical protein
MTESAISLKRWPGQRRFLHRGTCSPNICFHFALCLTFCLTIFLRSPVHVAADPIPIPQPFPVDDFLRGTYGEPLFYDHARAVSKGSFHLWNEFRYGKYQRYWDSSGDREDLDPYEYSRAAFLIGCDVGLGKNTTAGIRFPFIWRDLQNSDLGYKDLSSQSFGDLLIRGTTKIFESISIPIYCSAGAGVKFPTGEYHPLRPRGYSDYYIYIPDEGREAITEQVYVNGYEDLPTGTGSTDFSFFVYLGSNNKTVDLFADLGYVLTGTAEYYDLLDYEMKKKSLGDVFAYDLSVGRELADNFSLMMEINGYSIGALKDADGDVIIDRSYRLSLAPGMVVGIPRTRLAIEAGLSHDLIGKNTLQGTGLLLRLRLGRFLSGA